MKKVLKFSHTLSAFGLSAALISHLIILSILPDQTHSAEYANLRHTITVFNKYLLIPSFTVVLVSGLLSLAFNDAFHNAGWVWIKAALGLLMFEWVLIGISGPAQKAQELVNNSNFDLVLHAELTRQEWVSLWVMLGVVAINVLISIWRPRYSRRSL